jgi:hypothetical protein
MASTFQRIGPVFRPGALCFRHRKESVSRMELVPGHELYHGHRRTWFMLVERGLRVMNVEVVGDAYAIASSYLRKSGAIADIIATHEPLLEIVVELFHRGECNRLRLANRAIARFEAEFV